VSLRVTSWLKKEVKIIYNPVLFGKRLRDAHLKSGIDADQAGKMPGIEKNSYYKYEDGGRFPKPDIFAAIMDKFQIGIDYLITGEGIVSFYKIETTEAKMGILERILLPCKRVHRHAASGGSHAGTPSKSI
jgi:transcriptional regulator with XRE-family HTH domain